MIYLDGSELDYGPERVDMLVYDEGRQEMFVLQQHQWSIYINRFSNRCRAGVGIFIYLPEGGRIEQSINGISQRLIMT